VGQLRQDTKTAALKQAPLFGGLSNRQIAKIARLSDDLDVPSGAVLCKEGSSGQEFFMIIDGQADVTRGEKHVATLTNGDFFGEIALLEPMKRTATVTASTPLSFFVVTRQAFNSVIRTDPEIELRVLRRLARRLAELAGDPNLS
jgi:CRP/FNR family transcriptional regulator, cyclic AMP receptor protein